MASRSFRRRAPAAALPLGEFQETVAAFRAHGLTASLLLRAHWEGGRRSRQKDRPPLPCCPHKQKNCNQRSVRVLWRRSREEFLRRHSAESSPPIRDNPTRASSPNPATRRRAGDAKPRIGSA